MKLAPGPIHDIDGYIKPIQVLNQYFFVYLFCIFVSCYFVFSGILVFLSFYIFVCFVCFWLKLYQCVFILYEFFKHIQRHVVITYEPFEGHCTSQEINYSVCWSGEDYIMSLICTFVLIVCSHKIYFWYRITFHFLFSFPLLRDPN